MERVFLAKRHFVVKALEKAGIEFPISKAEALEKGKNVMVKTDFDSETPLASIIGELEPPGYENAAAFFCAYDGRQAFLRQGGRP